MNKSPSLLLADSVFLILLFSFISYLVIREKKHIESKAGDVVIYGTDTFDAIDNSSRVIKSERLAPESILDESSPKWKNTTENGFTFISLKEIPVGSPKIYKTLKIRSHE